MSKSPQMSDSSWSEQASQGFLGFLDKKQNVKENVSLQIQPLEKMKSKMWLHWGGSVRWGGHLEEAINTGQPSPGQKAPGKPQVSPLLNWAKKKKNSSIHPGKSLPQLSIIKRTAGRQHAFLCFFIQKNYLRSRKDIFTDKQTDRQTDKQAKRPQATPDASCLQMGKEKKKSFSATPVRPRTIKKKQNMLPPLSSLTPTSKLAQFHQFLPVILIILLSQDHLILSSFSGALIISKDSNCSIVLNLSVAFFLLQDNSAHFASFLCF